MPADVPVLEASAGGGGSRGGRCGGCRRVLAGLERGELRLQLVVLLDGLAPFNDDLVEVVVDLFGVEPVLEADVLELLVDDVIRGKCHGWLLFR